MTHFDKISHIAVGDYASINNKAYITFDIDWCSDDVLNDTIDLLESYDVSATWFVTHDTDVLNRLRDNPKFEIGIHPNFMYLLHGNVSNGVDVRDVIQRLMDIVPEAKSVRSHSVFEYSGLWEVFSQFGLTHECNSFIPASSKMDLKPWTLWNGVKKIPYFWEDDVACLYNNIDADIRALLHVAGLKVFDFHPIHVFLNSHNLDAYNQSRNIHKDVSRLIAHRQNNHKGVRSVLIDLLEMAK